MPKFDISLVIEAEDRESARIKMYRALHGLEDEPLRSIVSGIQIEPSDA